MQWEQSKKHSFWTSLYGFGTYSNIHISLYQKQTIRKKLAYPTVTCNALSYNIELV